MCSELVTDDWLVNDHKSVSLSRPDTQFFVLIDYSTIHSDIDIPVNVHIFVYSSNVVIKHL